MKKTESLMCLERFVPTCAQFFAHNFFAHVALAHKPFCAPSHLRTCDTINITISVGALEFTSVKTNRNHFTIEIYNYQF